jgi:CelD/BcsL family acetyltransferase involved in cellulose biosynthesis
VEHLATEGNMKLEWQRDPNIFEVLQAEWNDLLARSITRVPFLRAEYQRAWWQHRGGGEWPEAELRVATARDEAGKLIGVAPLFVAPDPHKRRALMLVGSHAISDYLDLIVAQPDLEAFATALFDGLTAPDAPAWEVLDLYNLPAASPTRAGLARAASARGWGVAEQPLEQTPIIYLPDNWEAYLAMMDKKERHELKRKIRRAEGGEDKIEWRFAGGEMIETFLDLMALDADKARFLTPAMRAQFREIVRAAAEQGWLKLAFLEVNGAPAAAYLNFDFENRLWIYNSAIDQRFGALSAGWVLLGKLLQWAIDNRRVAFDFMRGDEDYKFRFGAAGERVYRLQISPALTPAELAGAPTHQSAEAGFLSRGG